jgi:hypothetical protein
MGVELNPVGWVYSQAKLYTAAEEDVIERLCEIGRLADRRNAKPRLPIFSHGASRYVSESSY